MIYKAEIITPTGDTLEEYTHTDIREHTHQITELYRKHGRSIQGAKFYKGRSAGEPSYKTKLIKRERSTPGRSAGE